MLLFWSFDTLLVRTVCFCRFSFRSSVFIWFWPGWLRYRCICNCFLLLLDERDKKDKWYYIRINQITSKGWGMTLKCDLTFDSFGGPDFCFDCSVINTAHSKTDSLCTNSSRDKPSNLLDAMLWLIFGWNVNDTF